MQVVNLPALKRFGNKHREARGWLERWLTTAQHATWQDLHEVRATYASADGVQVKSGNVVTVFNVCGNKFRLIVTIAYERQVIYVWEVLTHAEYDKDLWKRRL
jgi:mRNA interferase HigB